MLCRATRPRFFLTLGFFLHVMYIFFPLRTTRQCSHILLTEALTFMVVASRHLFLSFLALGFVLEYWSTGVPGSRRGFCLFCFWFGVRPWAQNEIRLLVNPNPKKRGFRQDLEKKVWCFNFGKIPLRDCTDCTSYSLCRQQLRKTPRSRKPPRSRKRYRGSSKICKIPFSPIL